MLCFSEDVVFAWRVDSGPMFDQGESVLFLVW